MNFLLKNYRFLNIIEGDNVVTFFVTIQLFRLKTKD